MKTIKTRKQLDAIIGAHGDRLYVRWSRGPLLDLARGYSVDHATGDCHDGLSCENVVSQWSSVDSQIHSYSFIGAGDKQSYAWLFTGDEVERDTDNAPVVSADSIAVIGRIGSDLLAEIKAVARKESDANFVRAYGKVPVWV